MASRFLRSFVPLVIVLTGACGSKEPNDANSDHNGSSGNAGSGGAGRASGGASAQGGGAGRATGGGGGTTGGSSGNSGSGGGAGATTGGGAGSSTGGAGTGGQNAAGGSGGSTAGLGGTGTGGAGGDGMLAGTGGMSGTGAAAGMSGAGGMGSNLHGGASAAFVCPSGATYGDPLAGVGTVMTIPPPTTGSATYFAFLEGPVWVGSLGTLFFSDNASSPVERIWKLTPGTSSVPAVFQDMSNSNGMALDGDDNLIITDERMNRITRLDPKAATPTQTPIVPAGCKPNDIIVRSDGNIYYTAPNGTGTGFYRIDPSGTVTGPRTDVGAPNGIELSPDENTLYVGDVQNKTITKFSVDAAGVVGATGSPFATTTNDTADGMCVDCAGNLYVGTAGGIEVYSPAGAKLGTLMTDYASNCTFGGTDRKTIYVMSRGNLKSVTVANPGLPD
ncbi:MAG TPA: SMP-30/gluconolactonase/LRE family protein [Polyangiaceae bacterium]|jgi:gluconolactonase|nr:SMP-30/gluconolactonase/LRE family protein [Polyangiaceae bacterium]